jgi:hypothetical protein
MQNLNGQFSKNFRGSSLGRGAGGGGSALTSEMGGFLNLSIPDGVIGIFHWHNPSGRTMALGSTQLLTEISTRNFSCRVKAAGTYGWPYQLHVPAVLKSDRPNVLEPSRSVQACTRIVLFPFWVYLTALSQLQRHIVFNSWATVRYKLRRMQTEYVLITYVTEFSRNFHGKQRRNQENTTARRLISIRTRNLQNLSSCNNHHPAAFGKQSNVFRYIDLQF